MYKPSYHDYSYDIWIFVLCMLCIVMCFVGYSTGVHTTEQQYENIKPVGPSPIYCNRCAVSLPIEYKPTTYTPQDISEDFDILQPCGYTSEQLTYSLSTEYHYGMIPYVDILLKAEDTYGINAFYLMCKLGLESGWGQYESGKNNLGGWTTDKGTFKNFQSVEDCIMHISKNLSTTYKETVGARLKDVCERYCPDEGYLETLMSIMSERQYKINEMV